jgi:hypothetical protein
MGHHHRCYFFLVIAVHRLVPNRELGDTVETQTKAVQCGSMSDMAMFHQSSNAARRGTP